MLLHDHPSNSSSRRHMHREAALRRVYGDGGVLLTTYGMVLHNALQLQACPTSWRCAATDDEADGQRRLWDVMLLDEVRGTR